MRSLPTIELHDTTRDVAPLPCAAIADTTLSRRGFVSAATLSVLTSALATACGGGGSDGPMATPGPSASGVTYSGGTLTIPLSSVPALGQSGGFLITNAGNNDVQDAGGRRANVIVINVGTDQWRAFTSTCTHEQCTVGDFTGTRIRCFCHGSEYDSTGRVTTGPATRALQEYAVSFNATTRTITVARG